MRSSAALGLSLGVLVSFMLGCHQNPTPPAPAPSASSGPVSLDRLEPGELGEGTRRALGLVMPRGLDLDRVFNDSAEARGRVDPTALANYVRRHVDAASVEIAATRTSFPRAHVKGEPEGKVVRIEILRQGDVSVLLITDVTPPPIPQGLSEEERWRKAGVVPGRPFDPQAL